MPLKPVDQGALSEGRSKERELYQLVNRLRDVAIWRDNRRWLDQANWYWDPVNGNDNNSGASVTEALLTHDEIYQRTLGLDYGTSTVTINITDDVPAQTVRIGIANASKIVYQAAPTVVGTGTITAVTALNMAANQAWEITDSGLATSWTAGNGTTYVDKLLVCRSGSTVTASAFVDRDMTAKTARLGPVAKIAVPTLPAVASFSTTIGTPAVGDVYTVYSFVNWAPTSMTNEAPSVSITMYGLNFTGTFLAPFVSGIFSQIHCSHVGQASYVNVLAQPLQCLFKGAVSMSGDRVPYLCSFHGLIQVAAIVNWEPAAENRLSNGGSLRVTHCTNGFCATSGDWGIFDLPGPGNGITVDHQSFFGTQAIFGNNNTGTLVAVGGPGCAWYYVSVPTATTSGTELKLGIAQVAYAFAALPIVDLVENVWASAAV